MRALSTTLRFFIERIPGSGEFNAELKAYVAKVLTPGRLDNLAQTLLKRTAPEIPDTYQGSELCDPPLVDPVNREPANYESRRALLAELESGMNIEVIMARMDSGMPKMWVLYKALHLRREKPGWFDCKAAYVPRAVEGAKREHLLAFSRGGSVAVIVPRWSGGPGGGFASTSVELRAGNWKDIFTGEPVKGGKVRAQQLLQRVPVTLLGCEDKVNATV
jgi:(1->4)-alpha-D-glucan 1-alpha-D-glucosylmutase